MSYKVSKKLFSVLWAQYTRSLPYFDSLFKNQNCVLDHLAIIDLPSKKSGIPHLKKLLSHFGLHQRGSGYLPEKQNDFVWLARSGIEEVEAEKALLQPIVADFRLDEISKKNRDIILKYTSKNNEFNFSEFEKLASRAFLGDKQDELKMVDIALNEINFRPWGLPTTNDYLSVKEENQLIAWVLLNGRKVNHFGVSIHFDPSYKNLEEFNNYISGSRFAKMNNFAGIIKGSPECGIEQSATLGQELKAQTSDGEVVTTDCFMEFVWRFPVKQPPKIWSDYFTGFIPKNANNIVQSIYV